MQQRSTAVAVLDVGGMGFDKQGAPIAVDQSMTLASFDLLAGILTSRPADFRRFTLWLSMIAALVLVSRPARWRSAMTSAWFIRSNTHPSRSRANQR